MNEELTDAEWRKRNRDWGAFIVGVLLILAGVFLAILEVIPAWATTIFVGLGALFVNPQKVLAAMKVLFRDGNPFWKGD